MNEILSNPLVSIVMPLYNSVNTISKSVNSIQNQTFKNWCLIIVDDASTDLSLEIIKKIQKEDSRIIIICQDKNQGVAKARKKALDYIKENPSKYIAFCDSDDIWEKEKLNIQVKTMEDNKLSFSCTGAYFMNENYSKLNKGVFPPSIFGYNQVLKCNPIVNSSVLILFSLAFSYPYPIEGGTEDYAYWLGIIRKNKGTVVHGINQALVGYMLRQGSVSRNKIKAFKRNWIVYSYYEKLGFLKSLSTTFKYILIKVFHYKEKKISSNSF